ncbi:(2Fe-2S)-binding protein [Terrisporobacter mayombei]|uniref:Xanthine dehydrogenase subunit E n=1 Tax=Terrisporobacter mayombei TaxID=1541 RepID=A0ABY9Q1J2_9FIRM|nr:2Fe-2S iron-sulfur cluster-binding protein [Terrisporobacter mayombei]MCC3866846.1 2Fe-2S iron-sulfur cluster binding domain-containing protein [Terrisporobacter mayombei]WMT81086.1 putative xanthine dehydrogenase subunit E [Terrisporobacter mayombei]
MLITMNVNGKKIDIDVEADEYLVDTLRRVGNLSVKRGCDTGCCGLCSVWIDKRPTLSCSTLSVRANNKNITTIEGLQEEASEFAEILVKEGAEQCGFCSPGFIITVIAMKRELENPSEEEIKHYLTGNLCRCTGYMGQLRAIKTYMGVK